MYQIQQIQEIEERGTVLDFNAAYNVTVWVYLQQKEIPLNLNGRERNTPHKLVVCYAISKKSNRIESNWICMWFIGECVCVARNVRTA